MTETYETALVKVTNTYMPMITGVLETNEIQMTEYQKQCVMGAVVAINNLLDEKGKSFKDVDQRSLTESLITTAALQLNPAAKPREIYYITRNKRVGEGWVSMIEANVEGDGNDALLARFGRDVDTVHKFWEVRENDEFKYPSYVGLEVKPPEWYPTGKGKVVRVVYPITKTTGETEYVIAERSDVINNLKAHIRNNLMNETFGIAESRYKATDSQKKKIDEKKKEILDQLNEKDLDDVLADDNITPYISSAWKEPQSSEAMIVRKMRNNIVKKYPKNFESAYLQRVFTEATDDAVQSMRKDVTRYSNQEVIDLPSTDIDTETGEIIDAEIEELDEVEVTEKTVSKGETGEQIELIETPKF
ncbi:hypothetical protein [Atopobacter phocae]|uniref:hypothetical protein n=1 Tax=Atopobacter phocae TaxID=136492 RepID=UPI0004715CCA|nr:hypothetical protein [Atopobacter phocae]